MIFGNNTTSLGASTIPMAEGYDCSYGAALALVESARNDYAMFKAMIGADYREIGIRKEAAEGYVQEGQIEALNEAVGGGIFKKIAELFRKLVAKIKAIAHTFMSKINGIVMKDKDLVKKYQKELLTKKNVNNLEVKWRKVKSLGFAVKDFAASSAASDWKEEAADRFKVYSGSEDNTTDFYKELVEAALDDEDTVKLSEIGGISSIMSFISNYDSQRKAFDKIVKDHTTKAEKLVKEYEKKVVTAGNGVATAAKTDGAEADSVKTAQGNLDSARKEYDMAQSYQSVVLTAIKAATDVNTIAYKQNKAAFMKAIAAGSKKLEESTLLDAIAEAAEQEVEDVIADALSDEEISKICTASKNVKDAGVSDCPCANTYGPDCYTANPSYTPADGSVGTDINSKEESAFFGQMLY